MQVDIQGLKLAFVAVVCCCLGFAGVARGQSANGSCCLPTGVCIQTDQCSCDQQGGGFGGIGSVCNSASCVNFAFGACCTNTGCANTTSQNCTTIGGSFIAGGSCGGIPCNRVGGPCCCGGSCFIADPTFCSHLGYSVPAGTTCQPSTCPGACCDNLGNCILATGAAGCQGQFIGGSCTPNPCPGACCDAAGNCTLSGLTACTGTFIGGTCQPNPCPQTVCCNPVTGACTITTPCPAGSQPVPGPCTPTLCTITILGLCCDAQGNCTIQVAGTACNGTMVTGTSCQPNPCHPTVCCAIRAPGACQLIVPCPTGWLSVAGPCTSTTCPQTFGVRCDQQNNCFIMVPGVVCGGTVLPNVTSCQPNPCPTVVCCDAAGNCTLVNNVAQCNGNLYPNLTSCQPTPCSNGATHVVCCDAMGNCTLIVPGTPCNGTLLTNLSSCQPNPCKPNGACCQPCSGACTLTISSNCPAADVYFPGQPCAATICPTTPHFGNCCLNGNCVQATSCDCVLKGGTFYGTVPCNPALCAQDVGGACCNPNTQVCSMMSSGTCQAIGGQFYAGASCSQLPVPCPNPPSPCCCCGLCHLIDPQACVLAGGTIGTGTTCSPLICYPNGGACCNPATGGCSLVTSAAQCPAPLVFYSGQTCLPSPCIPSGACCDTCAGTCFVGPQSQCSGPLLVYTAGATCLPPIVCVPTCGACCTVNAAGVAVCTITSSQSACTASGGMWQGVGSTCPSVNNCIPPTVTCCNAQNGACQTFGGQVCPTGWFGNFSSCFPNPCPPFGACCLAGTLTCTMTLQSACNGQWFASGVCNPNPCAQVCCSATGCIVIGSTLMCPTGSVSIPASSCTPIPCPQLGICCINGSTVCIISYQANCPGVWFSGTSCTPNPCIQACCSPGSCGCFQVFGGASCPPGSNPVLPGTACQPDPCPPCGPCRAAGSTFCFITTQSACRGGLWGPAGGACTPTACVHACCDPNTGACSAISIFQLCPPGQTSIPNSACSPSPCIPVGPCCTFFSGCVISSQANCHGVFWGPAGGTCNPNPCVHVCCNTCTGQCVIASVYAICGHGFTSLPATSCSPNPCPQALGPCCLPNGSCITVSLTLCQAQNGVFFGCQGVSCGPTFCRGACCLPPNVNAYGSSTGTTCVLTTQAQCTGNWHGYGSTCASPPSSTNYTTCCPANVNHTGGVNVQDIFDFLAAWFAGCTGQPGPPCNGINADFNGDNVITIADIFAFLSAWFNGCH